MSQPPRFSTPRWLPLLAVLLVLSPAAARAQQVPGFSSTKQFKLDRLGENHWRATGQVEMEKGDMRFFADVVDFYTDVDRMEASGNVVFVSQDSRIAAERMEFNTKARTGTFYNASGTASMGEKVDRSLYGSQDPDAYFYGETIEKLGPAKYRITRGGFTTCVQPTPRWEMVSSSATIKLDDYAVLRNPVLRVKGVPMFYAPVLYYPIKKEDRATGFLLPMYGSSTVRGQSLSNAFFWAIARNQDATVFHDWFSKTGQGIGGEYRYIVQPGSDGNARVYFLNEHAATYTTGSSTSTTPPRRSYQIRGSASQVLPGRLRARANVDYFSDITVQQTYYGNLYDASRRQRNYGGNVGGSWGPYSLSGTYNFSEVFYGTTDSTTTGNAPRITFNRAAQRIANSPVYFSVGTEYVSLVRQYHSGATTLDQGLNRFDVSPLVRVPFTKWPFLTVNSSVLWRNTWYSESLDLRNNQVPQSLYRRYFDLRADITGPVFNRVWVTPNFGPATRIKHVIEPNFGLERITFIDNYDRVVKLESLDYTVGGTNRVSYGLTNRLLARTRGGGQTREFLNVSVSQTYYTDVRASVTDPAYVTSFQGRPPSNFSPVALTVRALPSATVNGSFRLNYDHSAGQVVSLGANGSVNLRNVQGSLGWSKRTYSETRQDQYLDAGTSVNALQGRVGGIYNFGYDFTRSRFVQQRLSGFYHAQCCGISIEYQKVNYAVLDPRFPVPQDTRFHVAFTLGGIGTFSPFFGMMGGSSANTRTY